MHEMTVAVRIRQVLESELADDADLVADLVRVQVGALSGVVPEALQFAWPHAVAESPLLASSTIEIDRIDAGLRCADCAATHTTAMLNALRCPVCRSDRVEIAGGDELDIVSVDIRQRTHHGS